MSTPIPPRFRIPGWRDEPLLARVLADTLPSEKWGIGAVAIAILSAPVFGLLALVSIAAASDLCSYDHDARCMAAIAGSTLVPALGMFGSSLPLLIYGVLRRRGPSFVRVLRDRAAEVVELRVRRVDPAAQVHRGEVTLVVASGARHRYETSSSEVLDALVAEVAHLAPGARQA